MVENGPGATPLTDVLRAHVEKPEAVAEDIEGRLAAAVEKGQAAWPGLRLTPEQFIRHVARHYPSDEQLSNWLEKLHADDLYLTSACADEVEGAIEALDRSFLMRVPAILHRSGLGSLQADEIRQRVRERLFVGGRKIGDYSGRGALASWVEVVTLRIAIDAKRQERPIADESGDADVARLANADPELEYIKERYRETFKNALRSALASLTGEQRNLLKFHFVDGVTLDQLAELFHVHRATITRRIATARDAIFESVRQQLQSQLAIGRDEFESLLDMIRSRLELSLSALLGKSPR